MSTEELIKIFKEKFEYREGILYWKEGKRCNLPVGNINSHGYLHMGLTISKGNSKRFKNHRIIYAMHYNTLPAVIDHIDRNPLNNKIENLREATVSLNCINRRIESRNTSGTKGVSYIANRDRWRASISLKGRRINLGQYKTKEEAVIAREQGEELYHNIEG